MIPTLFDTDCDHCNGTGTWWKRWPGNDIGHEMRCRRCRCRCGKPLDDVHHDNDIDGGRVCASCCPTCTEENPNG